MLSFGSFAIDLQRQELLRDGKTVDLSPRLVEILAYLASHSGETVSKDALLDRFWADVHVTENTLTRAIADIRKALADDAGQPTFIQTVARRGYRFIADAVVSRQSSVVSTGADPFAEWVRGRLSLEALDADHLGEAVTAFERAAAAAPDYAPAYAGLANAYFLQFEITRPENVPNRELLARATAHAQRATELDASLGEGWATLALVLACAGDVQHARAAARRASALEPTSWRHQLRLAMTSWGEERLRAADRALSLMPDFAAARFLAGMVFIARQAFRAAEDIVAKGAASQSRQSESTDSPFPAFGLHWLAGLLHLRGGAVGSALDSFSRELDEGRRSSVYFREFRVNALLGAGYAHLARDDATRAVDAFRLALESLPSNGRALLGLQHALSKTRLAAESTLLGPQITRAVEELTSGGRATEAALLRAALETSRGNHDAAVRILEEFLERAPAGQAGWMIPVDPSLAALRGHAGFERVLTRLAARAS
jgi:DNA-binding winged helix-turn-helix (wHTH) protein/Flp pilus assembly protein TadD